MGQKYVGLWFRSQTSAVWFWPFRAPLGASVFGLLPWIDFVQPIFFDIQIAEKLAVAVYIGMRLW